MIPAEESLVGDAPATATRARPRGRGALWVLAGVVVVGALLRFREARRSLLSFDEIYLVLTARLHFRELIQLAARDIHPPLGFLWAWAWRGLGGESPLWLKIPPILLGLLTLALVFWLGKALFSTSAGLLAAALLAFHPGHVQFSQEIEVFSLIWLYPVALALFGWRWVEQRRPADALALIAIGALAVYTHYLELLVIAALGLWGIFALARDRAGLVRWVGFLLVIGLIFLPQVPTCLEQFQREGSGRYWHWPRPAALADLARHVAFGATFMVPLFAAFALVPLASARTRRAALMLLLVSLLPLVSVRALPIVLNRDLLAFTPLVCVLVAGGIAAVRPAALAALIGIGFVAADARALARHAPASETHELGRAAAFLSARAAPGDLIVQAETHGLFCFRYYLPDLGRQRIWMPDGTRVPFFEGGLVVPDSLVLPASEFAALADRGIRWWGMRVDRTAATRGRTTRAGAAAAAVMDSLARAPVWRFGSVTIWRGGVGSPPGRRGRRSRASPTAGGVKRLDRPARRASAARRLLRLDETRREQPVEAAASLPQGHVAGRERRLQLRERGAACAQILEQDAVRRAKPILIRPGLFGAVHFSARIGSPLGGIDRGAVLPVRLLAQRHDLEALARLPRHHALRVSPVVHRSRALFGFGSTAGGRPHHRPLPEPRTVTEDGILREPELGPLPDLSPWLECMAGRPGAPVRREPIGCDPGFPAGAASGTKTGSR